MPQTTEYRVTGDTQWEQLQTKLNQLASEGFKPILMSSVTTQLGVITTVVLERIVTSQ